MTKEMYTIEIVNVVAYFNQMDAEKLKCLPTKMRWNIKKNLGRIVPIAKQFEEFRNELVAELQQNWFDDEHSVEVEEENGKMRKVKEEFLPDYEKAVEDVNAKLQDILAEKNTVEVDTIDVDGFVDKMPDDCPIEFEDLDVLSVFTGEA